MRAPILKHDHDLIASIQPALADQDLLQLRAMGDLQGGIEEAERLLGYQIVHPPAA